MAAAAGVPFLALLAASPATIAVQNQTSDSVPPIGAGGAPTMYGVNHFTWAH